MILDKLAYIVSDTTGLNDLADLRERLFAQVTITNKLLLLAYEIVCDFFEVSNRQRRR